MMNMYYCSMCNKNQETRIINKAQTLNVKGREITLVVPVRICTVCGEDVLDEELDNESLVAFYNEYRKLENLLLPTDIRVIRQKYGLSQSSFAKLLGFGEKTITRYENGAIQDICHDNLIRLMDSIESFILMWEERKKLLSDKEQASINKKLAIYNKTKTSSLYSCSLLYYSNSSANYTQGDLCDAG